MASLETVVLGGGCFWCTEAIFQRVHGVESVASGYAGGVGPTNYNQVSSGATDFIEVVKVDFDTNEISLEEILKIFFATHDPTSMDKQGNDVGKQYRSVIFYSSNDQKEISENLIKSLQETEYDKKIVTEVRLLAEFYTAEEYHQNFYNENPYSGYCSFVIGPKIQKFEEKFKKYLKK